MPVGSILGRAVLRTEDLPLLTGTAAFLDDLRIEGTLHAAFVRSPLAHARVRSVDPGPARSVPGVVGAFVASDLGLDPLPPPARVHEAFARPLLASEFVRFAGEPVAVVLAETRALAMDAAEAVEVDYEPLPAVVDPVRALEPDAPLLFPEAGTNACRELVRGGDGSALEGAEVVVRARFVNQRLAPVPMEPHGFLGAPGPDGRGLTVWVPCQAPFSLREELARVLGLAEEDVRVIAPAVGGGFGAKAALYPEQAVLAALVLRTGRPVRYVETRSENLLAMTHGRSQVQDVELGAKRDGTIVGLRARVVADMGAYPGGTYLPRLTADMASGVYRIPRIEFRATCVVTNTTPIESYRGAGRPEAAAMVERAVDLLAQELGMDPAEVRRRNFIPRDAFPYRTAVGTTYDSGDYEAALDQALRLADYEGLRKEQAERRARGDPKELGIGLSCYAEVTAWGSEVGSVEVRPDGSVTVATGLQPQGQGHETALAQLVEGTLGIPVDRVRVVHSDTGRVPRGQGTMGSRSLQLGGTAVVLAARRVLEKARRVAAHLLEVDPEDVEPVEGGRGLAVRGAPDTAVPWNEVAAAALDPSVLPAGEEPGLAAWSDFRYEGEGPTNTFPFGCHVAVVEVDTETGLVTPVRHVAVDDCGRILNPMLVDGQVHGGTAQGMAQALFEEVRYDPEGNPLTGSLMTYAVPSAADLPEVVVAHTQTPTPLNPLGAKGIGESATIGSTPAVHNAVIDALAPLGVRHLDMPLTPERVWRAVREVRRGGG
jgi:carbon-monoxide dehydrogenase large subunit